MYRSNYYLLLANSTSHAKHATTMQCLPVLLDYELRVCDCVCICQGCLKVIIDHSPTNDKVIFEFAVARLTIQNKTQEYGVHWFYSLVTYGLQNKCTEGIDKQSYLQSGQQ